MKTSFLDITFRSRKLERTFNEERVLQKMYGSRMSRAIALRMAVLKTARNLAMVPEGRPERRHQLSGNRAGQFAVDLVHPKRLVFQPNHDPLPRKDDGGINIEQVTSIMILKVVDYH